MLYETGRPTEEAQSTVLFVFDYYLGEMRGGAAPNLNNMEIDGIPFETWVKTYFPHIPVLVLTVGDRDDYDAIDGWVYKHKDAMANPDSFKRYLLQIFSEQWKPDFWLALKDYGELSGLDSWHTPGHNSGNAFCTSPFQKDLYNHYGSLTFQTDLSVSVERLGDLSEPDFNSPLKTSRERAARIFGAEDTLYVTNGTSTSNKAMLMTLLKPGDVVLLDRNCHKSVHQAIVMSGVLPRYIGPAYNKRLGVWAPLSLDELETNIIAEYSDEIRPRMLILTTCTYEGILYPIDKIADLCERNSILFYADEAWAPYLRFHPEYTRTTEAGEIRRYNAIDGGAHFAVQSTHKALAAFSQASMIHVSPRFKEILENVSTNEWDWLQERFSFREKPSYRAFRHSLFEVLRYWHSTSPNYPMLATLDKAGVQMRLEGTKLLDERLRWVDELKKKTENGRGEKCFLGLDEIVGPHDPGAYAGYKADPLKLLIGLKNRESKGGIEEKLMKRHIQWEKATDGCIEFLVTIGTSKDRVNDLRDVIIDIPDLLGIPGSEDITAKDFDHEITDAQVDVLPNSALNCEGEFVEVKESTGRICAQMLVPYPPGIPVFLPGLRINEKMIGLVQKLIDEGKQDSVHGLYNGKYVKVMSEKEAQEAMSIERVVAGPPDEKRVGINLAAEKIAMLRNVFEEKIKEE